MAETPHKTQEELVQQFIESLRTADAALSAIDIAVEAGRRAVKDLRSLLSPITDPLAEEDVCPNCDSPNLFDASGMGANLEFQCADCSHIFKEPKQHVPTV